MADDGSDCGGSGETCEILVSPIPFRRVRPLVVSRSPKRRSVTFVNSGKPNSLAILERARCLLAARGIDVADVVTKSRASRPMEEVLLAKLARDEGLVLAAVND